MCVCVGGKEQVFSFTLPLDDANIDQALFRTSLKSPRSYLHSFTWWEGLVLTIVSDDVCVSIYVCCGLKHFR